MHRGTAAAGQNISLINLAAANRRRRGEVWPKLVTAVIIRVHCRYLSPILTSMYIDIHNMHLQVCG